MKTQTPQILITKTLFIFIALASALSMAINTGSIELFLKFFSISSNMLISFVMIYLALYIETFQQLKEKKLVIWLIFGVFIYLLLWNGLPFLYWLYIHWFLKTVSNSWYSISFFILENLTQIVIIPSFLYLLLSYKVKSLYKEKSWKCNYTIDIAVLVGTFLWVSYLVVAAMR